ncbi:nuclear transport factor 2 family protein [Oceanibium sediminis]|uniref:nuclear transport factor 2 family protein n=1 Tax=Oceanibium sediminis TaxID=2026339 RepID=UPI000DD3BB2F|nr:nuclear transport factor 2 family protein [Oceanibium sediminis]
MSDTSHPPDATAMHPAEGLVRRFLAALEARDLEAARACLSPGLRTVFPATGEMRDLAEVLDWAAPRYQRVGKHLSGFDVLQDGATAIVYCRGTLHGLWPDGQPFDGIRFIDRFEIEGGLITRQDVWNDLAEHKGLRA